MKQLKIDVKESYTWVIENFKKELHEAKQFKSAKRLKHEFYLCQYRFIITFYLSGSNGNASYSSLFVHLIGGKYDGALQWPFTKTVKISLLRQGRSPGNFLPNITKRILILPQNAGKPRQEKSNKGGGFERFVTHHCLNFGDFTKDGKLYLKIELED